MKQASLGGGRPARLPILEPRDYGGGASVARPDLNTERALPDGVVEVRRGDGTGNAGREAESDQSRGGEDEGRVSRSR